MSADPDECTRQLAMSALAALRATLNEPQEESAMAEPDIDIDEADEVDPVCDLPTPALQHQGQQATTQPGGGVSTGGTKVDGLSPDRLRDLRLVDEEEDDGETAVRIQGTAKGWAGGGGGGGARSTDTSAAELDPAALAAIWGSPAPNDAGQRGDTPPEPQEGSLAVEQVVHTYERGDPNTPPYVVAVQTLDSRTTTRSLFDTFFPMGCARATVFAGENDVGAIMHAVANVLIDRQRRLLEEPENSEEIPVPYPVVSLSRRRVAGLVFFNRQETAKFAALKMHDFVPHGQSNPLHAAYLSGEEFAAGFRQYVAEPEVCGVKAAATQPAAVAAAAAATGGASHNASLNTSDALLSASVGTVAQPGIALPRKTVTSVQLLYSRLEPPLYTCATPIIKFAAAYAELEHVARVSYQEKLDNAATNAITLLTGDSYAMAKDLVRVLSEGITSSFRGCVRLVDMVIRRTTAFTADPQVGPLLAARLLVPISKYVVQHVLYSSDRNQRVGCAATLVALHGSNAISGSAFATCLKVFGSKVHSQPPSLQRDTVLDGLICIAACAKTQERYLAVQSNPRDGFDLLAAGTAYPPEPTPEYSPNDGPERDFLSLLQRHQEAVAGEPKAQPVVGTPANQSTVEGLRSENSVGSEELTPQALLAQLPIPNRATIAGTTTSIVGLSSLKVPLEAFSTPAEAPVAPSTLNAEILPCTVYVTRLPRSMSDAKLRVILTHYGEVTKVRTYESGKRPMQPDIKDDSAFCFVEYKNTVAAKGIVASLDRASLHLVGNTWESAVWHLTPNGQSPRVDDTACVLAATTLRVSPARSSIHDHDVRDAQYDAGIGKLRDCTFGLKPVTAAPATTTSPALLGYTTRPVRPGAVAPSFAKSPSSAKPGLNVGAAPWKLDTSVEMNTSVPQGRTSPASQPQANSSGSSSVAGFVVTSNE